MLKKYKYRYKKFPEIGGILVSKMVYEEGLPPLFMYREVGEETLDSGWRVFSGLEPEAFTDHPANISIVSAATMLKIEPSMKDLLLAGYGSVFERVDENSDWYLVKDFKIEDDYLTEVELSPSWTFELSNLFIKEIEEEVEYTQYFTVGDKSLRAVSWTTSLSKVEMAQDLKNSFPRKKWGKRKEITTYDLSDARISKIGYKISQKTRRKHFEMIYAYCFRDERMLEIRFYFDAPSDEQWALDTWKSVKAI